MNRLKINATLKILILCLVLSVLFSLPMIISKSLYSGHDLMFHISRIESLTDAWKMGDVFPSIFYYQDYNYGYGTPLFYSNVFLMFPAFLTYLGINVITSYKWFIFLVTFITSIMMFFASKEIFKDNKKATISTILYLFGSYRITDVYVRAAVGEYIAFMLIPLIMLGAYQLVNDNGKKAWIKLSIGFALLLLAHNISFILTCIAFGVYLLFNIKKILKKDRIISLIMAIVFAVGLSAFFLFPMLEQLQNKIYIVNSYFAETPTLMDSLLSISQLFQINTTYGYLYTHTSVINMSVGVPLICLMLCGMYLFRKDKNYIITGVLMLFILFMTTKYFPWGVIKPLWFIQFSCRLLVIAFPIMVLLSAKTLSCLYEYSKPTGYVCALLIIVIAIIQFIPVYNNGKLDDNDPSIADRYLTQEGFTIKDTLYALSGQEYLPKNCTFDYDIKGMIIETNSDDGIHDFENGYNTIAFTNTSQGSTFFIMPLVYYQGYTIHLYQNDVHIRDAVPYYSDTGLVMFTVEADGIPTRYEATYVGTGIQKWTKRISLLTLLLLILLMFKDKGIIWYNKAVKRDMPHDEQQS